MIVQEFYLRRVGWHVKVFYSVTGYYVGEIMRSLRAIGCRGRVLDDAYVQLRNGDLDTGLTYTNSYNRESIIVIAKSSSGAEFNNSLQHEQRHLERHITDFLGIDPNSEEAAYIAGDIASAMFSHAQHLMCDNCRNKD